MGTDFDNKTHEQMLEWLDHANSGEMQAAADRLVSAATEIRKIAEDLKVRPQWVEWKGKGADAFRTWSADLANATLRLGDYSEGVSKWLGEASNAVASAQASIPRTEAGARANLEAALAARNDPDASEVARKSAETLIESGKRNREEAAAQMRRLSQTYTFSSSQMTSLKKPVFPAMPEVIAPEDNRSRIGDDDGRIDRDTGGGSTAGGTAYASARRHGIDVTGGVAGPSGGMGVSSQTVASSMPRPVSMGIDGATAQPDAPTSPVVNPVLPTTGPRPDTLPPPTVGINPAIPNTSLSVPRSTSEGGRTAGVPRSPVGVPPVGPGPVGRPSGPNGITGGRVVSPGSGRTPVGIPRGTVIGSENTRGSAPMGRVPGMGGGIGPGVPPSAAGSGRRLAGEAGGVVGGSQQQGRAGTRPFTPGGAGLVRGSGIAPQGSRMQAAGRDAHGERPDYLVEDDETWQQGGRRVVPPVID
ncbi:MULTISPECIES: WXG100 family type VII secretion target [unclassified Streptomyces]|uniref:WXG100 family type VII secretion target n=1 Tax=unclassified Streptomyces TaxID=2593676 RepID=UPI00381A2FFD